MTFRGLVYIVASLVIASACGSSACGRSDTPAPGTNTPVTALPSILLVTLDTTRADAIGPEAPGVHTDVFDALSAQGRRFRQAYATAPETLPSHSSMMTGLYPGGHGVHENARYLADTHPVLAARLKDAGYRTVAFVSSFILARRFGLARGFDVYDDTLPPGQVERTSRETTDAVVTHLGQPSTKPLFLWVHYFDPHTPYAPPDASAHSNARSRYLGEVREVDNQMARLYKAFYAHAERLGSPPATIVVGDHGEGLGDHGELQHGNLLYQSTMHVPLVVVGPGIAPATTVDTPVSIRRVFHTVLDWAGLEPAHSLRAVDGSSPQEVVLAEAMRPFLGYGWQPQIMAIDGRQKAILAGRTEVYDVIADPAETNNLGAGSNLSAALRKALDDYPVPSPEAARAPENLTDEARRNLASLGYVSASAPPVVRKDAPRPADMVRTLRRPREGIGTLRAGAIRAGDSAAREDSGRGPEQPRRRPSSGDRALLARPRRAGACRVQDGRGDRAALTGCANLPGPALRPRQGLATGGAASRAHRGRDARAAAGRRSARGRP